MDIDNVRVSDFENPLVRLFNLIYSAIVHSTITQCILRTEADKQIQLTCILPSLRAGPSSASRRINRPMLYSFPPLRLKPKPRWLRSSSTTKQPCSLQTRIWAFEAGARLDRHTNKGSQAVVKLEKSLLHGWYVFYSSGLKGRPSD